MYTVGSPHRFDQQKVRDAMEEIQVTVDMMASTLNVNPVTIYRTIKGERNNLELQKGIAEYLKIPIEKLCKGGG